MADHIRQQIRERVATTLTGLTTTGSRVYQSRVYPMAETNMPGILIYSTSEDSEIDVMGSTGTLNRLLNLTVEGYVKSTTEFDDKIDVDICKEIETAMAGDQTINGSRKNSFLQALRSTIQARESSRSVSSL